MTGTRLIELGGGGVEGLPFWDDHAKAFGSTIPSIDRIEASKGYTPNNVRVVLLGVNACRGAGSDDDLYRIAKALLANRPRLLR
jgi:hypothetical protein